MNEFDWLLLGYQLDGMGRGIPLTKAQVQENNIEGIHWLHLHANYPETRTWLIERSKLDSIVIDALTAEETRPRMFEINDGAVIILRGVNLNQESEPEDMVSIRLYVDQNRIISVRKRRIKAVVSIEDQIEKGKGPKTTGEFIERLIERLCFYMEPTIGKINEQIDDIEENTLSYTNKTLRTMLIDVRRKSIILKRYLSPQRDVLSHLKLSDSSWLSLHNQRVIHESFDHLTRFVEDLDAARERSQIIHEEIKHALTDDLNRNMYILSVFAAIFLPLSFVTGLFGVNLNGIPGGTGGEQGWAFEFFAFGLIFITLLQIAIFKRFKWM